MALSTLEINTIDRGMEVAKKLVLEIKPIIDELNVIYDAQDTGVKATVTQEGLDDVQSYSGLTKAQLDDGMYVLTSTLKTALDAGYTQLTGIASRK